MFALTHAEVCSNLSYLHIQDPHSNDSTWTQTQTHHKDDILQTRYQWLNFYGRLDLRHHVLFIYDQNVHMCNIKTSKSTYTRVYLNRLSLPILIPCLFRKWLKENITSSVEKCKLELQHEVNGYHIVEVKQLVVSSVEDLDMTSSAPY